MLSCLSHRLSLRLKARCQFPPKCGAGLELGPALFSSGYKRGTTSSCVVLAPTRQSKFISLCSPKRRLCLEPSLSSRTGFGPLPESAMHAVDTNVLVRLIARDDARQVASAERFVCGGAWVSHLVLVETMWVLDSVFELRQPQIAKAVEMLLSHHDLVLQEPDVVAAALNHFRKHPKLGFSDCMVLEIARKAGHLPLGTFDRALSKSDGAAQV